MKDRMDNRKVIYLDDAIDALERKKDKNAKGDIGGFYNKIIQNDIDALMQLPPVQRTVESEVVICKDCIHRPIVDDPDATDGLGLRFPDFRCPCRCDDGYYSWMPNDNWFCGNGEKEEKTNERESRETGSGEVE